MEIYIYNMYEHYVHENETFGTSLQDLVLPRMLFSTTYEMGALWGRDLYARQFHSRRFHKKNNLKLVPRGGGYGVTLQVRTALFWAISRQVVVIPYRNFGTTFRSHFQVSGIST